MVVGSCHKSRSQVAIQDKSGPSTFALSLHGREAHLRLWTDNSIPWFGFVCMTSAAAYEPRCLLLPRVQLEAWFCLQRLVDYAADLLQVSNDTSQELSGRAADSSLSGLSVSFLLVILSKQDRTAWLFVSSEVDNFLTEGQPIRRCMSWMLSRWRLGLVPNWS